MTKQRIIYKDIKNGELKELFFVLNRKTEGIRFSFKNEKLKNSFSVSEEKTGLVTMNTHSRGHLFFVSSGGFSRHWSLLYSSESAVASSNT